MKKLLSYAIVLLFVLVSCETNKDNDVNYYQELLNDSSLVFYMPFNKDIKDESKNKIDIINFGATLTKDKHNIERNACSFNGINNYLKIDSNFAFSEISISLWVYPLLTPQEGSIIFKTYDFYNNWGLFYRDSLHILDDIDDNNKQLYKTFINEEWIHVVVILNRYLQNKLYINGNLVADSLFSKDNWASFFGNIYIGQRGTNIYNGFFKGYMDEIILFKRELTESEVKTLWSKSM